MPLFGRGFRPYTALSSRFVPGMRCSRVRLRVADERDVARYQSLFFLGDVDGWGLPERLLRV
jgi:hypothetical protein